MMKLAFETDGEIIFNCVVWERDSDRLESEVKRMVEDECDKIVNPNDIQEFIIENRQEYLDKILERNYLDIFIGSCVVNVRVTGMRLNISCEVVFDVSPMNQLIKLPDEDKMCDNINTLIYEGIFTQGDFVNLNVFREKLNKYLWENIDVSHCFEYRRQHCQVELIVEMEG